nr:PREDICTED: uncharacterized protein LOC103313275 [Tribolium castaneum]|eukprot:XP_008194368.1 PREDICTED: uncharacterized protein LOC103313275 [Tribolium castaneum]
MNPKEKNLILKKCASTNELGVLTSANLNLREAKSYAGAMVDTKLYDSVPNQRHQNTKENCCELFCKDYDTQRMDKNSIATKDVVTDEVYYIKEEFLSLKGRNYTADDIAWTWKKDCRMWMWKNDVDFKKNRSVAEMKKST